MRPGTAVGVGQFQVVWGGVTFEMSMLKIGQCKVARVVAPPGSHQQGEWWGIAKPIHTFSKFLINGQLPPVPKQTTSKQALQSTVGSNIVKVVT